MRALSACDRVDILACTPAPPPRPAHTTIHVSRAAERHIIHMHHICGTTPYVRRSWRWQAKRGSASSTCRADLRRRRSSRRRPSACTGWCRSASRRRCCCFRRTCARCVDWRAARQQSRRRLTMTGGQSARSISKRRATVGRVEQKARAAGWSKKQGRKKQGERQK